MCFISKKKLAKLQSSVDELTHIVKTNELTRLREESKKLKEIQALLSKVRFKVKDVKTIETDELGRVDVRITYQLPTVTLKIDDEGKPLKDDFFLLCQYVRHG